MLSRAEQEWLKTKVQPCVEANNFVKHFKSLEEAFSNCDLAHWRGKAHNAVNGKLGPESDAYAQTIIAVIRDHDPEQGPWRICRKNNNPFRTAAYKSQLSQIKKDLRKRAARKVKK